VGLVVCKRHVQAGHPPVHVSPFFTISFSIRKSLCMYDVVEVGQPPAPPPGVGVLYAANHPNALLDGALLMYALRPPLYAFIYDTLHMAVADFPIGFIAKATLFNLPIFGTILRWAGAIPIHRAQDAPAATSGAPSRAASNKGAFSEISNRLRQNGHVAIFPEGISHMEAHVMPLYTGITRMALDAVQGILGANTLFLGAYARFAVTASLQAMTALIFGLWQ